MTRVKLNTGNTEWNTPPYIVESIRHVLGGIVLDPCTNWTAQAWIKAERFYTIDDDALSRPWVARTVFMNPPYKKSLVGQFVDHFLENMNAGNIGAAITLTNNGTETKWGQSLLQSCDRVCFFAPRIKFLDHTGRPKRAPIQGQMLCYFGSSPDHFLSIFSPHGTVM